MSEQIKTLGQLCKNISNMIIDSKILIEVLEDILDADKKFLTILSIIEKNLDIAFDEIEKCREIISIPD